MKTKKVLSIILGIIIVAALVTGCSQKSGKNSGGTSTTAGQKTEKEKPTKDEFLEASKKTMNDIAKVCDKYGIKYDKNDEIHSDAEDKSKGYFLNMPGENKLSDGADNNYTEVSFSGTVTNDGTKGKRAINIGIQQDDYKTQLDVNTCKFLKDLIIASTGDSNYDFDKLNKKIKAVQDKREAGSYATDKDTVGEYTQDISVILEEGTNQKELAYKLYTGDVEIKK